MSHRRPDPRHQAGLEHALRHALRLAVDSVEPAADGLDRIRTKIAAQPRVARTGWGTTYLVGLVGMLSAVRRFREPGVVLLRVLAGALVELVPPHLGRAGL